MTAFGVSSKAELPPKRNRVVEEMDTEFHTLNNKSIIEQERIKNQTNVTNWGEDKKVSTKVPKVFNYCKLCESELVFDKKVELDFNKGLYKQVYSCPTCSEQYFSLDGSNLKMVRNPSISCIVEQFEI